MIRIGISEEAFADLEIGYWFYEAQESGLGDYFAACLRADIEGLKITGGIHRKTHSDYRRLLSRAFPFAIFYTAQEEEVTIWAVVDSRRDPDWIQRHLDAL